MLAFASLGTPRQCGASARRPNGPAVSVRREVLRALPRGSGDRPGRARGRPPVLRPGVRCGSGNRQGGLPRHPVLRDHASERAVASARSSRSRRQDSGCRTRGASGCSRSGRTCGDEHAPFAKGVLAFNVAASAAYAGAAFARTGPYERDTRGMASQLGDRRAVDRRDRPDAGRTRRAGATSTRTQSGRCGPRASRRWGWCCWC